MLQIFIRICFVIFVINNYFIVEAQDSPALTCSDVKNGTFSFFDQKESAMETFIRKGNIQKEIITKHHETIIWEVNWLNDCTYTLKYQSGAENHPAAEQKALNKHIIVTEILQVTNDYLTFRSAFDKVTNPTVINDTMWIK